MRTIGALLPLCILLSVWAGCGRDQTLHAVQRAIDSTYASVPQISTDSLAHWLADPSAAEPLLLDVRTEAEYRVSHLRGALRVDPDAEDFSFLENTPHDTPIVVYCSVGYRSSALAERLMDAGYVNVSNLSGSIFKWANEDHPVYRDDEEVREVHPYSKTWGTLLKRRLRAYEP